MGMYLHVDDTDVYVLSILVKLSGPLGTRDNNTTGTIRTLEKRPGAHLGHSPSLLNPKGPSLVL